MIYQGFLVLESGEIFEGQWLGGQNRAGEVVFNTTHSGYEEVASDPSYYSQIVVMTAPMQGNYGSHSEVLESKRYWIEGFVCLQMQNSVRDQSWISRLLESGIPIFTEVDTRSLVKVLRNSGTQWGALVQAISKEEARQKAQALIAEKKKIDKDWVFTVTRKKKEIRTGKNLTGPRVAILDYGSKENILREVENLASEVCVFSSRSTYKEIMDYKPHGVLLTNGPGDPKEVQQSVNVIRELIGNVPVFGICMGHQLLALALGGETYRLRFGHRGSNHPVKDDLLKRVYMTSHNHGYAVEEKSLPSDVLVTHRNLNDNTVSGFYSQNRRCLGIQFHPESCPGPHEAQELFRFFTGVMI
ncbi:MAG TPA: glutamine-hydrolyzing carbamoyl-phosphate synthase small subunit [Pseudobdellovibrionaceae bacterium]|nr:glutamine-hydrolyzing carbamoyl-phosphate synthase small subunit [Pseudobdellovibrionaceae bacterium]